MTRTITANGSDQWSVLQGALAGTDHDIVLRGTILHSRALTVPDNIVLRAYPDGGKHGLQSLNDTGPASFGGATFVSPQTLARWGPQHVLLADDIDHVARDHLAIVGDNVHVFGIFIHGTNVDGGRSINFRDPIDNTNHRNWLESETGITTYGANGVLIEDVDVAYVYGDGYGANAQGSGTSSVNSSNVEYRRGSINLIGRHAFGCNGCNGLKWSDTKVGKHASSVFHIETGLNPRNTNTDIDIGGITNQGGGDFLHVRAGQDVARVKLHDCHSTSTFYVSIAPQDAVFNTRRFEDITIDACSWVTPMNELVLPWHVDGLTVTNLNGQLTFNGVMFDPTAIKTCTKITSTPNPNLTKAAQP